MMNRSRIKAIAEMLLSEIDCPQQEREEDNRLTRNLTAGERAVLGNPHPGDFGIPKEHWEAAKVYAMFYSENYLVAAGQQAPSAAPEWISVEDRLPEVELGSEVHCFAATKNKVTGAMHVIDLYYVNRPLAPSDDEDYPDWTLSNDDDGYMSLVGWADRTSHPDYDGYFSVFDTSYREVIAWQEIVYPAAPKERK